MPAPVVGADKTSRMRASRYRKQSTTVTLEKLPDRCTPEQSSIWTVTGRTCLAVSLLRALCGTTLCPTMVVWCAISESRRLLL